MGAGLEGIDPLLSAGVGNVFGYLLVKNVYVGVCGVGGTEVVTLGDEAFSQVGEVRDEVRNVAIRDVVFGGCLENAAELGLPGATGGGQVQTGKALLGLTGERLPVRFVQVDIGDAGWVGLEVVFKEEEYGKVI